MSNLKDEVRVALKEIQREDAATARHNQIHNEILGRLARNTPHGMVGACICGLCNNIFKFSLEAPIL